MKLKLGLSVAIFSLLSTSMWAACPLKVQAKEPEKTARYFFVCKEGDQITLSDTPTKCYSSVTHINDLTSSDFNKELVVVQPSPGAACNKGSIKVDMQHRANRLQYLEDRLMQLLEKPSVSKRDNTTMSQVKYEKEIADFYKQKEQLLAQFNTHKAGILTAECESKSAEAIHHIFDNQFMKAERLSNRDKIAKARALLEIEIERNKVLYGELNRLIATP